MLDIHFRNIYQSGIQVIVVNWAPSQSLELIKHMMNYAKKSYDSKIWISLELAPYDGRSAQSVRADLQRLRDEFVWAHPAMYRVRVASRKGEWLPMVYIQGACAIDSDQWAEVLGAKRVGTVRRSSVDAVFIGEVRYTQLKYIHYKDELHICLFPVQRKTHRLSGVDISMDFTLDRPATVLHTQERGRTGTN